MPIDEGIKKSVIALRLWNFPTDGSCEGHLKRALPYPWIDIYTPEQSRKAWIKANKHERKRLKLLLNDFYKNSSYHHKFKFENIGVFGGFRLLSSSAKREKKPDFNDLKESREDFEKFADFLLDKLQ